LKESISEVVRSFATASIKAGVVFSKRDLKIFGIKIEKGKNITNGIVKKIRKKLKISQSVFASLLGVETRTISNWEQGLRRPSGTSKTLLNLLDKNPSVLNYKLNKKKPDT